MVRAAKPLAELANPAAVGKLLTVRTPQGGRCGSMRSRWTKARFAKAADGSNPFNWNVSRSVPHETVVRVRKPSRVIDSDDTAGRFSAISRLPQYLIRAMFGWAMAVAEFTVTVDR